MYSASVKTWFTLGYLTIWAAVKIYRITINKYVNMSFQVPVVFLDCCFYCAHVVYIL